MNFIDTHIHLYLKEFEDDIDNVVNKAKNCGVKKMLLPNIDKSTVKQMLECCKKFKNYCYPMIGLHPTSVKENWEEELKEIENIFIKEYNSSSNNCITKNSNNILINNIVAIGECGIDLYWDKTYEKQQIEAFKAQIEMSLKYSLPIVIHSRSSIDLVLEVLSDYKNVKGVLHCFPGNVAEAKKAVEMGLMLGIGGVVTYKKSLMREVVKEMSLENILLETDAPYLPPVPHRGKRNESSYLPIIANEIALIKNIETQQVSDTTFINSCNMFKKTTLKKL